MADGLTPAGELREAARRLRELAGPVPLVWQLVRSQIVAVGTDRMPGTDIIGECQVPARAAYVASMHPGVALAVADWLEEFAAWFEREVAWDTPEGPCCAEPAASGGHDSCWYHQECDGVVPGDCHCFDKALAVARAYLGSKETDRG